MALHYLPRQSLSRQSLAQRPLPQVTVLDRCAA